MANATVKGRAFEVPDDIIADREATTAYLMQRYGFSPQDLGGAPEDQFANLGPASAFTQAALVSAGERLSHVFGGNIGDAGIEQLRQDRPIATGFGDVSPLFAAAAAPIGIPAAGTAALIAGGQEAFQPGASPLSTTIAGTLGAAGEFGGQAIGAITGRVVNAVNQGVRGLANAVKRSATGQKAINLLDSGIQATMGKITGNRQLQQAEASLARNPVTSGPFVKMDEANEAVARQALLDYVGSPGGSQTLQEGLADAQLLAVHNMDTAIPADAEFLVPATLVKRLRKLEKAAPAEFEAPVSGGSQFREKLGKQQTVKIAEAPPAPVTVTGSELRAVISDLRKGAVSPTGAVVRRNSRQALGEFDEVIAQSDADLALWREGSQQYKRWIQATNGRAVSKLDPEKINPTTVLNNLKKGNKAAVQSRGNLSSGNKDTDKLIQTMEDFQQVGQIAPDSGTATGLSIPIIGADIVHTGGVGTLGTVIGSRASQSEAAARAAAALFRPAPAARATGGAIGAAALSAGGARLTEEAGQRPTAEGPPEPDNP